MPRAANYDQSGEIVATYDPAPATAAAPERKVDRGLKYWLELLGLALAFAVAVNGWIYAVNSMDRQDVYAFFTQHWFPTAISDPNLALSYWTTENYRQLPVGDEVVFPKFWRQVKEVPKDEVTVSDEVKEEDGKSTNKFDVHWRWNFKDGKTSTATTRVHVTCTNFFANHLPLHCEPEDIRLDDSQRIRK